MQWDTVAYRHIAQMAVVELTAIVVASEGHRKVALVTILQQYLIDREALSRKRAK